MYRHLTSLDKKVLVYVFWGHALARFRTKMGPRVAGMQVLMGCLSVPGETEWEGSSEPNRPSTGRDGRTPKRIGHRPWVVHGPWSDDIPQSMEPRHGPRRDVVQ